MGKEYQDYFGDGDISRGKARMMQDIRKHRLTGSSLGRLIDDLESNGMLMEKPFIPKPKTEWNDRYLGELSNGHISDYFSRGYLEHFGEVAEHLSSGKAGNKFKHCKYKKPWIMIGAILLVLALLILYWIFISSNINFYSNIT